MNAASAAHRASAEEADAQHLEFRLVPPRAVAAGAHPCSLAVALDEATRLRVRSLDVVVDERGAREDAVAAVERLAKGLPQLQGATVTCLQVPSGDVVAEVRRIGTILRAHVARAAVDFRVDEAADPLARGHDRGALGALLAASRDFRDEGVTVRWLVPTTPAILYRLEPLFSLARDEGIEPILTPRFASTGGDDARVELDRDQRLFLHDFIRYRLLDEERQLISRARYVGYERLNAAVVGGADSIRVAVHRVAVLAKAEGGADAFWPVRFETRPSLDGHPLELDMPDATGSRERSPAARFPVLADIGSVLMEGGLGLLQRVLAWAGAPFQAKRAGEIGRVQTALLVGAYGGDHIGDAAILGGVLLRLHRRHGLQRAILMSQRAEHTRHLVEMLDTPVSVEVDDYTLPRIRSRAASVDAVVFAGGPLTDLPKQLVKHFYAASLARRQGKPFIMEGIGPGPFPRWPSQWTARRLVRMASRISVRTSIDVHDPLLRGVAAEPGHDPAFDYLATRPPKLASLRLQDAAWVDRLLHDSEGSLRVGINLRPIRHLFAHGVAAAEREELTRRVEAQCERALAEGMARFHRAWRRPVRFIFFPMNAVQFGSSDLRSAYRLHRVLDPEVDFRVWQADAGLDGVVSLLRRLDVVITMRFHATIFALSQQRRVIGVDYRIGKQDKVGALMADAGQSDYCRRIDEVDADWVFARLVRLAESRS